MVVSITARKPRYLRTFQLTFINKLGIFCGLWTNQATVELSAVMSFSLT